MLIFFGTHIAASTFTKMNNNQMVSLEVVARICYELGCGFDDVVELEKTKMDI